MAWLVTTAKLKVMPVSAKSAKLCVFIRQDAYIYTYSYIYIYTRVFKYIIHLNIRTSPTWGNVAKLQNDLNQILPVVDILLQPSSTVRFGVCGVSVYSA